MPEFEDIQKQIDDSITAFMKSVPGVQKGMLEEILYSLRKLDLDKQGSIKNTIANIRILNSISSKIDRLVLTPEYLEEVKDYIEGFNEVTRLQNAYWKQTEKRFKPTKFLKELRNQTIEDTVNKLTEAGISANLSDPITDILRTSITSGGSYKKLDQQLRDFLTDNAAGDGALTRYSRQITTDALNQYSANYSNAVSSDLGYVWFVYQGTDIKTTRPFCDAMTDGDRKYFHLSEVPGLLKAEDLYYSTEDGKEKKVPIYEKTGLPNGMVPGTNPSSFFIYRGGYNCGHQIRPVSERQVPLSARSRAYNSSSFSAWARANLSEKERERISQEKKRLAGITES